MYSVLTVSEFQMEIHCWDVEFASDSVGRALKRTADNLVNKGTEIPDAAELFAVCCVAKYRNNNQAVL